MDALATQITDCRLCAERFRATATGHAPRPVAWFRAGARLRIIGQAPGMRVHNSGRPFDDPSGDRLRAWMGVSRETFYDTSRIAITPIAFCFPGYDAKGADLPPPRLCAETWHDAVDATLAPELTLVVGGYAQKRYLATRAGVTQNVRNWRAHFPDRIPLPHPSWRNTRWLKDNPWFEDELLPALKPLIKDLLAR